MHRLCRKKSGKAKFAACDRGLLANLRGNKYHGGEVDIIGSEWRKQLCQPGRGVGGAEIIGAGDEIVAGGGVASVLVSPLI